MGTRRALIVAAALAAAAWSGAAAAQTIGSTSLATLRSCATTAAGAACDGSGPGQSIVTRSFGGGVGIGGYNGLIIGGNQAWSDVSFDPTSDLPIIRAFTAAPGDVRMNVNVFAFQSFLYTGSAPIAFSITSVLDLVDSSTSPGGGALPGGAIQSNYVGVWDPAILTGLTTAEELFNALFYAPCGTAGVLGAAIGGGTLTGGPQSFTLTSAACAAGSLTLTPGQEVLVVAGLQLPVNRGGFADSTGTLRTRLGDDLTEETRVELAATLASATDRGAILAVPEPESWALMIAGFGLAGAALRRRAATAATA